MDYIAVYHDVLPSQIHTTSKASPNQLSCEKLLEIIAGLNKANSYLKNCKYKEAILLIDKNIILLGDHYLSSRIIIEDDTGTKLMLGKIEQKNGNWRHAAYLKRNVLESRVEIFQQLHRCPLIK